MPREPVDSTADLPTLASADALEVVSGYTLVKFLGEGALCRAYECREEKSGQFVVVKVLGKDIAKDRSFVQRILRESRVIAGLRHHAQVARVLDVGEGSAGPYVVFEKLAGGDLRSRLVKSGRLPVADALAICRDAAKALDAAAGVGVAHRDVKPANLFLFDDGSVKLTDFGFAAPLSRLGGPANVYGTPAFVAPELLKGAPPDVRTDIYALGSTLFQLMTARPLFDGETTEVLAAHGKKPVPSIATMVPDAGIAVVDILYRLLHKEPARRPQTHAEVVTLLDGAVQRARRSSGAASGAPAPSEPQWPTAAQPTELLPSKEPTKPEKKAARARQEVAQTDVKSPFDQVSKDEPAVYQAQPTGVMGTLKQMGVTEILQMLEISKKSARVDVQFDGGKGVAYVHDGQVMHAKANELLGEPAVVVLCRQKEGFFRIHYEKEPCERNVHRNTTFVLLEALKTIDETASHAPAPRAAPPKPAAPKPQSTSPTDATQVRHPNKPPSGLGDGIERDDLAQGAHGGHGEQGERNIDDPTLPEVPHAGKSKAAVTPISAEAEPIKPSPVEIAVDVVRNIGAQIRFHAPRLWAAFDKRCAPLAPRLAKINPRLADSPGAVAAAGALVVALLVLIVVVIIGPSGAPDYRAAVDDILDGDAHDVVESLGEVPPGDRTLWQDLALGHAYAVLQDDETALALYRGAVAGGAVDPMLQKLLLGRLSSSAPDDELDMLVLWPDPDIEDELELLALSPHVWVRQNAVGVLVERGALGRIDVATVSYLDLLDARSCPTRRAAIYGLRYAGKTKQVLDAVERVGRDHADCFNEDALRQVYKQIQRNIPKEEEN